MRHIALAALALVLAGGAAMAQNYYYVVPTTPYAQVPSTFGTQLYDPTMAPRQELMELQAQRMRLENERLRQQQQQGR